MKPLDYTVKLKGDTSNLEQALKLASGKLQRLNDDEVLIKLNYDGNYKEFYKIIQNIYKAAPEVGIKFQYDLNKKALDVEKAKLEKMLSQTDVDFLLNNFKSTWKEFQGAFRKLGPNANANHSSLKEYREELVRLDQLLDTFSPDFGSNKAFEGIRDIIGSFKEYDSIDVKIFDESEINKQKALIDEIENNLKSLESSLGGIFDGGEKVVKVTLDTSEFDAKATEIKNFLNDLPDEKKIKIGIDLSTVTGGRDELADLARDIREATDIKGDFFNERSLVGNSKTGYISNKYVTDQRTSVSGALNTAVIDSAKEAVDTFIHTHPERFAAFSDTDINTAFHHLAKGLTTELVLATDEVMKLNTSQLDVNKKKEILSDYRLRIDNIKNTWSDTRFEEIKNVPEVLDKFVEDYISKTFLDDSSILNQVSGSFNKAKQNLFDGQDWTDGISQYYLTIEKSLLNAITQENYTGKDTILANFYDNFKKNVHQWRADLFQKILQKELVEVFNNKNYWAKGVTQSPLSVTPIEDFKFANQGGNSFLNEIQNKPITIPIIADVEKFLSDFQSQVKSAPPIAINVTPISIADDNYKPEIPNLGEIGNSHTDDYINAFRDPSKKAELEDAVTSFIEVGIDAAKKAQGSYGNIVSNLDMREESLGYNLNDVIRQFGASAKLSNEQYAIGNSKTGYGSIGMGDTEAEGVSVKLFHELVDSAVEPIDTWIHTHPNDTVAFSPEDIENAFKEVQNGITKQIVTSASEVMTLDLSNVNMDKSDDILASIKSGYDTFDRQIGIKIKSDFEENISSILSGFLSENPDFGENNILKNSKIYYKKLFSEWGNKRQSTDDILNDVQKTFRDVASIDGFTKDDSIAFKFEDYIQNYIQKYNEQLQSHFQKVLLNTFNKSDNLIGGAQSALSISSIDDFKIEGNNAFAGYSQGMREEKGDVEAAAKEVTEAGLEATRTAQDSHSPSEEYKKLGRDAAQGYIEGWKEKEEELRQAVSNSINSALLATKEEQSQYLNAIKQQITEFLNALDFSGDDLQQRLFNFGELKVNIKPNVDSEVVFDFLDQLQTQLNQSPPVKVKIIPWDNDTQNITNSVSNLQNEASSLTDVFTEATKAAKAKAEFVEANKNVAKSASDSAKNIDLESEEFKSLVAVTDLNGSSIIKEQKIVSDDDVFNAEKLREIFGETYDIYAQLRRDTKTGELLKSYRIVGEKSSGYISPDGKILRASTKIGTGKTDAEAVYKKEADLLKQIYALRERNVRLSNSETGQNEIISNDEKILQLEKELQSIREQKQILNQNNEFSVLQQKNIELEEKYQAKLQETDRILKARAADKNGQLLLGQERLPAQDILDYINTAGKKIEKDLLPKNANQYINAYINSLKDLQIKITEINDRQLDLTNPGDIAELQNLKSEIDEIYANVNNDIKKGNQTKLSSLYKSVNTTIGSFSGMSPELMAKYEDALKRIQSLMQNVDSTSVNDVAQMTQAVNLLDAELKRTGQDVKSFWKTLGQHLRSINAQFLAQYLSIQDFIRYGREAINVIRDIDSSLTELRKVSNASTSRLQQSLKLSTETARELGSSISDVVNITADWSRLGYDIGDAEELARVTTLFKNVGDNMSAEESSSYLISTLKGFKLEASQAESIIDKYNEVANNFAIDTKGIGESLQRSAASFNAAHTDINKSIALITTTNAVLQNPEAVGTLYKTMSARIRGAKTELQDLGEETDKYVESTSKLRDLVKGMTGFDIMEKDGKTYKDIYEIILGIAEAWDKLDDIDQAALAEALAGKRAANGLFAVLQDPEGLKKAYETALNAEGSAAKEQENYAKSIQYSIDVFKASLQDLATDVIDSQFIKGVVDFGTQLIQILDEIIERFGIIAPMIGIIGTVSTFKTNGTNILDSIKAGNGLFTKTTTKASNSQYDTLINQIETAKVKRDELFDAGDIAGGQALDTKINDLNKELADTSELIEVDSKKLSGWGEALKNIGISFAIGLATTAIYEFMTAHDKLIQKVNEVSESYVKENQQIHNFATEVQSQYDILNDASSSFEQQYNARQKLYDIQGQLIEQYPVEANNIDLVTDSIDGQSEALQRLIDLENDEERWASTKREINNSGSAFGKFANWFNNRLGGYDNNFDRIISEYEDAGKDFIDISGYDKKYGNDVYQKLISRLSGINGLSITNRDGYQVIDFNTNNAEELNNILLEAQGIVHDINTEMGEDMQMTGLENQLESMSYATEQMVKEYGDIYNEHIFRDEILNHGGEEIYNSLTEAYNKYREAKLSGDQETVDQALSEYNKILDKLNESEFSPNVVAFLQNLYPQIQGELDKHQFLINVSTDASHTKEQNAQAIANRIGIIDALRPYSNVEAAMASNDPVLKDLAEKNKISVSDLIDWANTEGFIPTEAEREFNEAMDKLSGTDAFGKLSAEAEKWDKDFKKAVVDIVRNSKTASEALEKINDIGKSKQTKGSIADAFSGAADGMNQISNIIEDLQNGKTFDFTKVTSDKFGKAFENITDEVDAFREAVLASGGAMDDAVQGAADNLADALIRQNLAGIELTETNRSLIESILETMNVTNAEAYAAQLLADANAEAAYQEIEKASAGDQATLAANLTAAALDEERFATDADRVAFVNYILQKQGADWWFGTGDQQAALEAEAAAAMIAAGAYSAYNAAKAGGSTAMAAVYKSVGVDVDPETLQPRKKSLDNLLKGKQQETEKTKPTIGAPRGGSGGSGGGGGGGGDSNKGESAEFDLSDQYVKKLEHQRDKVKRIIDDEAKTYSERLKAYRDDNYEQRQAILADVRKYADEYNKLTNGNLDYNKRSHITVTDESGNEWTETTLDTDKEVGDGKFTIKIATILEDGTQLTPEEVDNYINTLDPTNSETLLASDKKNLIIQWEAGPYVEGMFDTLDKQLDSVKQAEAEAYRMYEALTDNSNSYLAIEENLLQVYKEQLKAKEKKKADTEDEIRTLFGDKAEEYIDKLTNGRLLPDDIELKFDDGEITKDQKEALEKLVKTIDEVRDSENKVADQEKQIHDDRINAYKMELELLDNILSLQQAQGELYEAELELKEATGQLITVGDYQVLIDNAEEVKKIYEQQIGVLQQEAAEMEPLSAEWYGVQAEIMEARTELVNLTKQQAEWNEAIRKIPINLMDQYLSRLRAIQRLVEGYQNIETAFGRNPESDSYQELFGIGQKDIDRMIEQSNEYQELLKSYEWGSTKYDETAESIESIHDEINSTIESMIEWNKTILNLPLEKFQAITDQMNLITTSITDVEGEYDQVISAVTTAIDKQTEAIEKEQEAFDNGIDDQIKGLQDILDLLQKTNDEREHQNALEQAQAGLDKANHEKTIAIIRDGQLTYEADQEAIRKAQQELEDAEYEMQVFRLQQQIDALEKQKEKQDELYADELDNLSKMSEKWSEITENIQYARDALKADEYLGNGWFGKVTSGNDMDIYTMFKKAYETADKNLLSYEEAVKSNERIATLMQQYIDEFMKGNITLAEAQAGIGRIAASVKDGFGVEDTVKEYQNFFQYVYDTRDNSLSTILGAMQDSASGIINGYLGDVTKDADGIVTGGWLALAQQNNDLLDNYTQSWKELKKTVEALLEQLEKDYQEALERSKQMRHISQYLMDSNEDGPDEAAWSSGWANGFTGEYYSNEDYTFDDFMSDLTDSISSYHTGVNEGLVNASPNAKLKAFKDLTLQPLAHEEVPAILKQGELVLTPEQQGMLLRNVSQMSQPILTTPSQGVQVNLTMSNLTFHEINNGQDFANYITNNLSSAIAQGLARG